MKKIILPLLLLLSMGLAAQDSTGLGEIMGKILDKETSEPIPFVAIILEQNDIQINAVTSDFDGNYEFKNIPLGEFSIKASSVGFRPLKLIGIKIEESEVKFLDVKMDSRAMICCMCCCFIVRAPIPEPTIDLFAEADSLNKVLDTALVTKELLSTSSEMKMNMFPNPTRGMLQITNIPDIDEIILMETSGKILRTISVKDQESIMVDLTLVQPGMYIFQYMVDDQLKIKQIIRN